MQLLFKTFLSVALTVSLSPMAQATMLINPPSPYVQAVMGDTGFNLYFAGSNDGTIGGAGANTNNGYRILNTSAPNLDANLVYLDITSSTAFQPATGQNIVITLSTSNTAGAGTEVPLLYAGNVNGNGLPPACSVGGCQGTNYKSALYSNNQVIRVAFSLASLCSSGGTLGTLCNGNAYTSLTAAAPNTLQQTIYVTIGLADVTTGIGPIAAVSGSEQTSFNLNISSARPVLGSCPNVEQNFYFPGDQQIYLKSGNFAASTNGGPPLKDLLFMAKPSAPADTGTAGVLTNPVVSYPSYGNEAIVKGFNNSFVYQAVVYAESYTGALGDLSGTACTFANIQSRAIRGVLAESKCFIATAAFQDGRAAPVMMLRRFRDQILSKFSFGRRFISTYYTYSPALAEWAWDKPIIRSVALRALAPVEFFAWALLKFTHAQEANQPGESQPYIDRLKKQLADEDQKNGIPSATPSESYTEQLKKRLGPTPVPSNETYIERLKKNIPASESSENYSEKTKNALPPVKERESPIQAVKEKRSTKLGYGEMKPIENAVSFKLGVSPGMEVTAAGGPHTYNDVYNSSWKPDFIVHFEHQFMHDENFGSFAGGVDFGVNYAGAPGLFDVPFAGSSVSRTNFSFVQFPLIFSGYYRFNLARILRPYVGAGIGTILYTEIRNDDQKDKRGYSFVYTTSVGASLLLDFFDKSTSRDSYLSMGIQHTYLFVEYMYLNTFQTSVTFKRAGIYSGFLFEF